MSSAITPVPAGAARPLSLLHRACFPDDPWGEAAMGRILGLFGAFGFVAWEADEPVGFVLARSLGDEGEILALGVLPQARRRGTARALMQAAIAEGARRGLPSLVLEVAADNASAQQLYAGLGFVAVGRRPRYYRRIGAGRVDGLILRQGLGSP